MVSSNEINSFFAAIENSQLAQVVDVLGRSSDVLFDSKGGESLYPLEKACSVCASRLKTYKSSPNEGSLMALKESTRIANLILSKSLIKAIDEAIDEDSAEGMDAAEYIEWICDFNQAFCTKKLPNGLTPSEYAESINCEMAIDRFGALSSSYFLSTDATLFRPQSPSDLDPEVFAEKPFSSGCRY